MYDTLIIGAGMSGLAAGIRLAYYDQRVCILERHYTIGGLNSFYRLRKRDFDVGLHAVTNFTPKGAKKGPLARILRQLRFRWDDFALREQVGSQIAFPSVQMRFGNDFGLFRSEVHRCFPCEKDNFEKLLHRIVDYDDLDSETFDLSTRAVLSETIADPLLIEMLLCPLMWYGNAREHDMDFGQFCVMFRSIFVEGLARPHAGVRLILRKLVRKFRALGGELKLRSGVAEIRVEDGRACGVVTDDGREIEAKRILSSAGWTETMRLCSADRAAGANRASDAVPSNGAASGGGDRSGEEGSVAPEDRVGRMSFTEAISVLDRQPREVGCDQTVVFFNDSDKFHWEKPNALCDMRTGVICSPNNYQYEDHEGELADGVMRVTSIANFDRWQSLSEEQYALEKNRWYDRITESAARFVSDYRGRVIDTDMFTPTTIRRFTGHDNGAVYGATKKQLDGTTPVKNLFVCGADQGFVGIIGTMMSGVAMANRHCLREG